MLLKTATKAFVNLSLRGSQIPCRVYPEHADATTSCACSPDGRLVSSGSHNGDFRMYALPDDGRPFNNEAIHVQDCAHDLGKSTNLVVKKHQKF